MIPADRWVQCRLSDGDSRLVVMLPAEYRLKAGTQVRLKDAEDSSRWWRIDSVGQPVKRPNRGWENNI